MRFATIIVRVLMGLAFVGGGLLVLGRLVPLGLTLLGPVIVNVVLFHFFVDRHGMPVAFVVAALALFLLGRHRASFIGLVHPRCGALVRAPDGRARD